MPIRPFDLDDSACQACSKTFSHSLNPKSHHSSEETGRQQVPFECAEVRY